MRYRSLICLIALSSLANHGSSAATPALADAASFTGPTTPWSIVAGVASRNMRANFSAGLPSGVPWLGLLGLGSSGRGDVGLFDGGDLRVYDNGQVGGFAGSSLTEGTYTSSSQVRPTGRRDVLDEAVSEVVYSSYAISHSLSQQSVDLPGDSDRGLGAFVRFSGSFGGWNGFNTGISLGWTGVQMSAGLTDQLFGRFTATEHRTDYGYAYDAFVFAPSSPTAFLVYDTAGLPGFAAPRKNSSQSARTVDRIDALIRSDLDVVLNEVAFTFDLERYVTQQLALAVSAGPTLNAVSTDFDATARYVSQRTGRTLLGQSVHDSHTHIVVGFVAQLMARWDLTPKRDWYLQGHAGYHWLPNVDFATGDFGGDIDLSSWNVGFGIGRRF